MHKLKFYGFFIGMTITIMSMCDLLAFKVVRIGGFEFAASGLIYSFSFFLASVATEIYGYNLAGRIIWIQLISHVTFIITVNIFVLLPSPDGSQTYSLYLNLYHNMWRVLLGSCIAIPASYFINDFILSKVKLYMYGRAFMLRFLTSNIVGSAILVSISYPVNFYNQYPIMHIMMIAFNTWLYKVIIAMILLPLGLWLTKKIKDIENLDFYDYGVSYNPINVFSGELISVNKYEK